MKIEDFPKKVLVEFMQDEIAGKPDYFLIEFFGKLKRIANKHRHADLQVRYEELSRRSETLTGDYAKLGEYIAVHKEISKVFEEMRKLY